MKIAICTEDGEVRGTAGEDTGWTAVLRVDLDEDGTALIAVDSVHNSDNGVPFHVWHRRTLRYTGEACSCGVVSEASLNELASKLSPLLDRVSAGHTVEWDGNNMKGQLTDDAQEASDEVDRIVNEWEWQSDVEVWDAADWVFNSDWKATGKQLGLSANSTDEDKKKACKQIEEWAERDGVVLQGVAKSVDWFVDTLAEEQE